MSSTPSTNSIIESASDTEKEIASTKKDIANLIQLITMRKKECDDMENETRYLKEYVSSFITMGDLKK